MFLKFGYLLHIEVIFTYGVRKGSNIHVFLSSDLRENKCFPCTPYTMKE